MKATIELNFQHFDKDGTGYLEGEEVTTLLDAIGKELKIEGKVNKEDYEQFMRDYDDNGDGKFTRKEAYEFLYPIVAGMEIERPNKPA